MNRTRTTCMSGEVMLTAIRVNQRCKNGIFQVPTTRERSTFVNDVTSYTSRFPTIGSYSIGISSFLLLFLKFCIKLLPLMGYRLKNNPVKLTELKYAIENHFNGSSRFCLAFPSFSTLHLNIR